jgi:membrane-bound lytic murein transglycosylase D
MRASGSKDLATMISRYHRGDFQFASSNFFTCFLAAMYAEKYHDLIFRNVTREPIQSRAIVQLGTHTPAHRLTKLTGVDREQLLEYNLDLRTAFRNNATLPRGFKIFVPAGARDMVDRRSIGLPSKKPSRS